MKLLFALTLAALSLPAQPSKDEAAVRDTVRKYVDARDHPDTTTLTSLFTPDADQLVSSGVWRKGREEVVRGTIASSQNETGKRTITLESIRFLSPTVALADGRYEIGDRKMWTTLFLTKDNTVWRIAAIRNMLPAK